MARLSAGWLTEVLGGAGDVLKAAGGPKMLELVQLETLGHRRPPRPAMPWRSAYAILL